MQNWIVPEESETRGMRTLCLWLVVCTFLLSLTGCFDDEHDHASSSSGRMTTTSSHPSKASDERFDSSTAAYAYLPGTYSRSSNPAFSHEAIQCTTESVCRVQLAVRTELDSISATLDLIVETKRDTLFLERVPEHFLARWPNERPEKVDLNYEEYSEFIDVHYDFSSELRSTVASLDTSYLRKGTTLLDGKARVFIVPSTRVHKFNRSISQKGGERTSCSLIEL